MHVNICSTCARMDPQNFICTKYLKNIHDIESCDLTEYHPFNMRADDKSEKQMPTKAPFDREAMAGLVRHMRLAATYSTSDEEYAKGFFAGWTTACGAILSSLGESPNKWMKDEDR